METAGCAGMSEQFSYGEAFSRNIGWVTEREQQILRTKRVAIAGMGGVGGAHLLTLTRLGVGAFHVADPDIFEVVNFNRQQGADVSTLGSTKVDVLAQKARDINSELHISTFAEGVTEGNIDAFLEGVDLFVDGLDFFVLDIRARVFARCHELGIPAITAAPLGMGVAWLVFMPGAMSFERYFRFQGELPERQQVNFLVGLSPRGMQRVYLVDPSRVDLAGHRGPSTIMACEMCAGVAATEALKILIQRGCVHPAPWYHQFDAFRGKWARGWMPGGNRNPLQVLRRHIGYRHYARMARDSRSMEALEGRNDLERILELSRWAPSGDNAQPWRFDIQDEENVLIHLQDQAGQDVYDYRGQPSLLAFGCLVETLRIAATGFGRSTDWRYKPVGGGRHLIDVTLKRAPGVEADPLLPFIRLRSVDRRPYQWRALGQQQKVGLAASLGEDFSVRWLESTQERWHAARIVAASTDIRLRIKETYATHQRILDWERTFSPDGVPSKAVGVDGMTERLMGWAMQDWSRVNFMNRFMGATLLPRLELDLLPGLFSGAFFMLLIRSPERDGRNVQWVRAGKMIQRFWLTATSMGLVVQPTLAPLCFAYYGRENISFTDNSRMRSKAATLANQLEALVAPDDLGRLVVLGRIGWPRQHAERARSTRKPLSELLDREK